MQGVRGHRACIIVDGVKQRLSGLGRQLVGYAVIVIAVILVLWLLLKVVAGFVHTLIFVAVLIFALYALSWGMRVRRSP